MLTYDQGEYIRKQFIQFMQGKINLEKINSRIQKKLGTTKDFKKVIAECKKYNRGYSDITWAV